MGLDTLTAGDILLWAQNPREMSPLFLSPLCRWGHGGMRRLGATEGQGVGEEPQSPLFYLAMFPPCSEESGSHGLFLKPEVNT